VVFERFLRDELAPRLRALGFIGTSSTYRWPVDGWLMQLAVKKSIGSDRHRALFTIGVSVVELARWDEERRSNPRLPKRPIASSTYDVSGDWMWASSIHALYPDPSAGNDWWSLRPTDDLAVLAARVATDVDDVVVSVFRRAMALIQEHEREAS
jgi:hypothetical protein